MTEQMAPVVAVDGPGGTGKGTLCLRLARALGWHFLDSGALYRIVAWAALTRGSDLGDEPALARQAAGLDLRFEFGANDTDDARVIVAGQDVSDAIRSEDCARAASRVATLPGVRAALLGRQRAFRQWPGLIADGRDMGTAVFPCAALKIFLSASAEERALRRYKQLKEKGIDVTLAQLLRDIAERDERDRERTVSPLRPASDAVLIDTTGMGKDAVFERVTGLIKERSLVKNE
jgi:cytidylate kinase